MSNPSDIGKSITENIRFVSRLGAECIHLTKLIKEELSRLLLAPEVSKRYRAIGGWMDTYASDDQNWVNTELGSSLPVIIKPKRSVGGYLVVQISLTGSGVDAKRTTSHCCTSGGGAILSISTKSRWVFQWVSKMDTI